MFFFILNLLYFFFQFETNLSVQLAKKLQLIVFVEEMESLRVKKGKFCSTSKKNRNKCGNAPTPGKQVLFYLESVEYLLFNATQCKASTKCIISIRNKKFCPSTGSDTCMHDCSFEIFVLRIISIRSLGFSLIFSSFLHTFTTNKSSRA